MIQLRYIIVILMMVPAGLFAQPGEAIMYEAQTAYDEGRYEQVISLYDSVLESGVVASEIYYNLGNAYFKLNQIPAAILNYERAKKLAPKDESISFNLDLANSRIIDKIEAVPELFYISWWKQLRNRYSIDGWAWMGITFFILGIFLLGVFYLAKNIFIRKLSFWSAILLLLLVGTFMLMAFQKYKDLTQHNQAIIFTPTITIKSSPNENSVDLFVIHEGTKVEIIDHLNNWSEIRIADGSVGWVMDQHFKTI